MLTGLIIGKFMPLTKGHIALIEFGLKNCDNLIVALCSKTSEPIDGLLRYHWTKKYFESNPKVKVVHITREDLPDDSVSNRNVSEVWAHYLKELFPEVGIIFASEKYGEYVAEYMNIEHKIFNEARTIVPISATKIRENPYAYWDFIPDIVKPYYTKKVCIYGSDSCGKSTLTINLANHYNTAYVPELARSMFDWSNLDIDNLTIYQLEQFAKMQSEAVKSMVYFSNKVLFCDSDNLTTQIYSDVYCGHVTDDICKYDDINYDLYLFMDIDVPYVEEPQRNLAERRAEMRNKFIAALEKRNRSYILIKGTWEERFKKAVTEINKLLYT